MRNLNTLCYFQVTYYIIVKWFWSHSVILLYTYYVKSLIFVFRQISYMQLMLLDWNRCRWLELRLVGITKWQYEIYREQWIFMNFYQKFKLLNIIFWFTLIWGYKFWAETANWTKFYSILGPFLPRCMCFNIISFLALNTEPWIYATFKPIVRFKREAWEG